MVTDVFSKYSEGGGMMWSELPAQARHRVAVNIIHITFKVPDLKSFSWSNERHIFFSEVCFKWQLVPAETGWIQLEEEDIWQVASFPWHDNKADENALKMTIVHTSMNTSQKENVNS